MIRHGVMHDFFWWGLGTLWQKTLFACADRSHPASMIAG